jgi:hypothetical protein
MRLYIFALVHFRMRAGMMSMLGDDREHAFIALHALLCTHAA